MTDLRDFDSVKTTEESRQDALQKQAVAPPRVLSAEELRAVAGGPIIKNDPTV